MFVVNIESAKKQQSNEENIHISTCFSWLQNHIISYSMLPIKFSNSTEKAETAGKAQRWT